jgi:hypothetical protein
LACGVSGIGDNNLVVVCRKRFVNYPFHFGVLTTVNRCVLAVLGGPFTDATILVFVVGVIVCILLVGLRGVGNDGLVG